MTTTMFKYIIAGMLVAGSLASCEKMIEIPAPISETSSERVFSSDKLALAALSGAMSNTVSSQAFAINLTVVNGMAADELLYIANSNYDEIATNIYSPLSAASGTSLVNSLWSDIYAGIYRFNSVIEGVTASSALKDSLKTQLIANAKFMRGLCYFYLVNLYRDVPLVLKTDVNVTSLQPGNTAAEIYAQIIADLKDAKEVLPADFTSQSGSRTVITKWAAGALLARVYLYTEQWQLAIDEATNVIDNGLFAMGTLSNISVKNNTESILQFGSYLSATSGYTYMGLALAASYTQYTMTDTLRHSFTADDQRGQQWIHTMTYNNVISYQPYKYQNNTTGTTRLEAPTVLRLAEQYLIRAEASLHLQLTDAARADMNIVRVRAGLGASTSTDAATLALEIESERRHELFAEYGLRWFDLRRTGRINTVLGALKSTWTAKAAYFPLPQSAINANPNLVQNPDYN
ncbi:RagB/SusD family nutrient uptake outer membrane protein [Chitinophaga sancti]|uniref:RagB/SusD family nutrient uptake outer membrane protein n=1 Tax=Chitinophaga sancti TaxID=1004 RepID=UPI003F7A4BDF